MPTGSTQTAEPLSSGRRKCTTTSPGTASTMWSWNISGATPATVKTLSRSRKWRKRSNTSGPVREISLEIWLAATQKQRYWKSAPPIFGLAGVEKCCYYMLLGLKSRYTPSRARSCCAMETSFLQISFFAMMECLDCWTGKRRVSISRLPKEPHFGWIDVTWILQRH